MAARMHVRRRRQQACLAQVFVCDRWERYRQVTVVAAHHLHLLVTIILGWLRVLWSCWFAVRQCFKQGLQAGATFAAGNALERLHRCRYGCRHVLKQQCWPNLTLQALRTQLRIMWHLSKGALTCARALRVHSDPHLRWWRRFQRCELCNAAVRAHLVDLEIADPVRARRREQIV